MPKFYAFLLKKQTPNHIMHLQLRNQYRSYTYTTHKVLSDLRGSREEKWIVLRSLFFIDLVSSTFIKCNNLIALLLTEWLDPSNHKICSLAHFLSYYHRSSYNNSTRIGIIVEMATRFSPNNVYLTMKTVLSQ